MAVNPNEDTEFNDALRKYGVLPPREPTPPTPSPPGSPTMDDLLNDFTPSELREVSEDAPNDETERMILAYRRKRLAEQRKADKRARFGQVYPIGREDYTREVTEASLVNEEDDDEETGTGVVCFLYKDGIPRSDRTFEHIRTLAARYPRTKFVSIVGDKCIPNLQDSRIPMLIVYKKGEIRNQIIAWAADKERHLEELEAILMVTGALHLPERPKGQGKGDEDGESEEDDDPSSRMRSAVTSTNRKPQKNIRSQAKGDESDSDFDFDL
ncbi:Phosducin-like protein 3 [Hypsizygus marmoreus]|uniref:Phosducin-like protein 3 n=1 Tax=Hypsizygus marmoreus TaxID=39966 RepID=A0A369JP62_HYPMA|nr:Phosducin-like protein 3 [Hypsizygus marmoreus]